MHEVEDWILICMQSEQAMTPAAAAMLMPPRARPARAVEFDTRRKVRPPVHAMYVAWRGRHFEILSTYASSKVPQQRMLILYLHISL